MVQTCVYTSASTKSLAVSFSLPRDESDAWFSGMAAEGAEDVGWAEEVVCGGVLVLDSNRAIHLERLSFNHCSGVCVRFGVRIIWESRCTFLLLGIYVWER